MPNDIIIQMAAKPQAYAMFEGMHVCKKDTAEATCEGVEGKMTPEIEELRDNALSKIELIELNARMNHAAKKVMWLEDNPYPEGRPRMYWPTFYHQLNSIRAEDMVCKDCRATPEQIDNMRKPVWQVHHISDRGEVRIKEKTPMPTMNDQFLQCPECAETYMAGDDMLMRGLTAVWVVKKQKSYQPCPPVLEGRHVNSRWVRSIPMPPKEKPTKKRKPTKRKDDNNNNNNNKENNNKRSEVK